MVRPHVYLRVQKISPPRKNPGYTTASSNQTSCEYYIKRSSKLNCGNVEMVEIISTKELQFLSINIRKIICEDDSRRKHMDFKAIIKFILSYDI